jgi:pimeloyl-ACP methyl ester carboxylesterase
LIPIVFVIVQFAMLPGLFALYATNAPRSVGGPGTPADLGSAYRVVTLVASDGVRLAGWWVPSRNGAAVIALAGSGSTKDDVLTHAGLLIEHGYGVLLYDARGHGSSEGRSMEYGWNTAPDVSTAVDFVLAQSSVTRGVSVLGLSMGGETAITAAAADPRIRSVIAEGVTDRTFADVQALGVDPIALATSWETFALVDLLVPQGPPIPLVDAFRRVVVPVFLIEGAGAREQAAGEAYLAAGSKVTLWSLPDTPHIAAIRVHPARYEQRLIWFLDAAM